ncbi:MAG: thioredoxin domain-containing protein [Terracidiphilus sp.]
MNAFRYLFRFWIGFLCIQIVSAQTPPGPSSAPGLERKIELLLRLKFEVPTACEVKIGARTSSPFAGYDRLRITLAQDGRSTDLEFLISKDNKSMARIERFDLDQADPSHSIDILGRPIRGNPNAQVTIINFDDLECPVCARIHEILKSEIMQAYGDRVRFIYKDNPLTEIHPWAMHAAVDAGCLAQQDANAYWTFVDYIHTHGQEVEGEHRDLGAAFSVLDRLASESGQGHSVDKPILMACLKKQDEAPVRNSMKEARDLGLDFTPALFVNGELVRGLTSLDNPQRAVERALKAVNSK